MWGDPVAAVIGENLDAARDAADLVAVDYEELPVAAHTASADEMGAPLLHEAAPDNVCFDWENGNRDAVEAAFANAHHVDEARSRRQPTRTGFPWRVPRRQCRVRHNQRALTPFISRVKNPHMARSLIANDILHVPENQSAGRGAGCGWRVRQQELRLWGGVRRGVGRQEVGSSGQMDVRSVGELSHRFAGTRSCHARGVWPSIADGTFLALRVKTTANLGAYLSTFGPAVPDLFSIRQSSQAPIRRRQSIAR